MNTTEQKREEVAYVAANCGYCEEPLLPKEKLLTFQRDDGKKTPVHVECFMRMILGSAQHQLGEFSCRLGLSGREEPTHLTKRQNARLALDTYYALQGVTEMEGLLL